MRSEKEIRTKLNEIILEQQRRGNYQSNRMNPRKQGMITILRWALSNSGETK